VCEPEERPERASSKEGASVRRLTSAIEPEERSQNLFVRMGDVARGAKLRTSFERALRFSTPASESVGAIGRLSQVFERSIVPVPGEVPLGLDVAIVPEGERLAQALRSTLPRRALDDLIAERVDEIRPQGDLAAVNEALEQRFSEVATSLTGIRKDLKARPMQAANKRLESSNRDLIARIEALTKRVEELEKA